MSRACCSVPTDVTTTRTEGAAFAGRFTGNKVREARPAVKRGRRAFRERGSIRRSGQFEEQVLLAFPCFQARFDQVNDDAARVSRASSALDVAPQVESSPS